jgi:hypothetical protein|tara:strand:+ start:3220 stop:3615 length:396 start_codon:yes stop_codon:yes gene_type:complete
MNLLGIKIKDIEIEKVREFAVDLLSKSYMELGQRPNEEDIVMFAVILAEDLKEDFPNLELEDIRQSFRQGIRNSEKFHMTVKTYYHWIKSHRQIIWDNESKEPERKDKRLKYRSRNGTGLKKLNINKNRLK